MASPSSTRSKVRLDAKEDLSKEIETLKREAILKAAAELFYEQGYLGTSVDAIAERTGTTKPFIYYRFSSKLDILVEICQRGTRAALAAANTAISGSGSVSSRLQSFVEGFVMAALDNQQFVSIYFREEINLSKAAADRINKMRKEIDHDVRDLLVEGVESGEFSVDNPHITALAITGMASYPFAWYRREGRMSRPDISFELSKLVMRMVTKTESTARTR